MTRRLLHAALACVVAASITALQIIRRMERGAK